MTNLRQALLLTAVCGAFAMSAGAAHADPLGGKEPWNFQPQNRAGIAATIKAIEDGGNGSGGGLGGGTTIVCGGTSGGSGDGSTGSGSSATANSSCIIVNGSTGSVINVGQDSDGNQDADAETKTKTSNSKSSSGSIDEVAAILGGPRQ